MTEWFTTFFDQLANDFSEAAMPRHLTEEEVAYLVRTLEFESSYEAAGITMSDRHRYDARESRLDTTVTFSKDGVADAREMWHWVLTSREVVDLLERAGFGVEALYGDIDEVPFDIGAPRLLVVARRRE